MASIMDATPICVLKRTAGTESIQKFIEYELIKLSALVNVVNNLKPHQIVFTAETIIENYPAESLEDIVLCFRRGAMGYYGKIYHQLDTSTIMGWMAEHIDEKCNYLEKGTKATQEEEKQMQVDYEAFKKKIEQKRKETEIREAKERELDIRRFVDKADAVKYQTPAEIAVQKQLHLEWIKQNYHPITGKPLDTWMAEDDWISEKLSKGEIGV